MHVSDIPKTRTFQYVTLTKWESAPKPTVAAVVDPGGFQRWLVSDDKRVLR